MTSLSQKSLNNSLTRSNSDEICGWSVPDYSSAIALSFNNNVTTTGETYTAPENGKISYSILTLGVTLSTIIVSVNGKMVEQMGMSDGGNMWKCFYIELKKGDVINFAAETNFTCSGITSYFFPLHGV